MRKRAPSNSASFCVLPTPSSQDACTDFFTINSSKNVVSLKDVLMGVPKIKFYILCLFQQNDNFGENFDGTENFCSKGFNMKDQSRIIHEAGEAEASGPGP